MARLALLLDAVFLALAFGLRTLVQWRRTGDSGWRLGRPRTTAEGAARALLLGAAGLIVAAPFASVDESSIPRAAVWLGVALALFGAGVVVAAQLDMGGSWRIGVDPGERTELVRGGLYRWIRNPIYSGMVAFVVGQALVVPNAWSAAAFAAVLLGVEIQVRAVEEPYLRATHGQHFARWAAEAGRFVPGLGRLRG